MATVFGAKAEVLQRAQEVAEKTRAESITDSLRFPEIEFRQGAIENAYTKTFNWIYNDSSSPFMTWVKSDSGIFWVSGKPGSGKSTLMKYLTRHPKTQKSLSNASRHKRLVLTEYYFWYLGTSMQKSVEGLLRSLLYQILKACPHTVAIASPKRWNASESFHRNPDFWTYDELWKALSIVAGTASLEIDFCFFLDGLDEYDGDHLHLVELLGSLASHPCVKICASSRPWNVFDQAFGQGANLLRLEDLTRADIRTYVSGELKVLPHSPEMQLLVSDIVDKAEGVFLWVYLVVKSLRKGFIEGDSISILRERLEEFPTELGNFFDLIYPVSIPSTKRGHHKHSSWPCC